MRTKEQKYEYAKKWNKTPKGMALKRKWWKSQKGKDANYNSSLKIRYGISLSKYKEILAEQGGVCACCGGVNENGKNLSVDHDHDTGVIRGLLCNTCNVAIGYAGDSAAALLKMAQYILERG